MIFPHFLFKRRGSEKKCHSPRKCIFIVILSISWIYVILGNLVTNNEYQNEIFKLMKAKDAKEGKVHNLIRGIYNKNKGSSASQVLVQPDARADATKAAKDGELAKKAAKKQATKPVAKKKDSGAPKRKPGEIILDQKAQKNRSQMNQPQSSKNKRVHSKKEGAKDGENIQMTAVINTEGQTVTQINSNGTNVHSIDIKDILSPDGQIILNFETDAAGNINLKHVKKGNNQKQLPTNDKQSNSSTSEINVALPDIEDADLIEHFKKANPEFEKFPSHMQKKFIDKFKEGSTDIKIAEVNPKSKEQNEYSVGHTMDTIDNHMKLFKIRQAYRDGLPLDFYLHDQNEFTFECQQWPNDYTFIQQLHYMYEEMQKKLQKASNDLGPVRKEYEKKSDQRQQRGLNVFMILSSVSVFFINNTVFVHSSQFMYTINLFVETISFLYMAKYFEYDGSHTVAMVMQLAFFYLSHQLIKSVLLCFGAEVEDYCNLSYPEIPLAKLKSVIISGQKIKKDEEQGKKNQKKDKQQMNQNQVFFETTNICERIEPLLVNKAQKNKKKPTLPKKDDALKKAGLIDNDPDACDSNVQLENVDVFDADQLGKIKNQAIYRVLLSFLEVAIAQANVTGSQSDLIHIVICLLYGQLIYRCFELIQLLSPTPQIDCSLYHIQSSCGMVITTQILFMISTFPHFWSEKLILNNYYSGELCDLMSHYQNFRYQLLTAYVIAVIIKFYNSYYTCYVEMNIEARQKDCKVSDVMKLRYYTLFTDILRDSESTFSFFNWENPVYTHIIAINYVLFLLVSIQLGSENGDHQLINMAIIGFYDILVECFDLAPNWRRRQLLFLDEFCRIGYGQSELWHMEVRKECFIDEKFNMDPISIEDYYTELETIREHYGTEPIANHLKVLKDKQMDKAQFLRSLAQFELTMWKDKNRLSWFYISKLFMIIYWLFGGQNVLVVTIQLLIKCSELAYELAIKAYNYYQDESAKEGSQKPCQGRDCLQPTSASPPVPANETFDGECTQNDGVKEILKYQSLIQALIFLAVTAIVYIVLTFICDQQRIEGDVVDHSDDEDESSSEDDNVEQASDEDELNGQKEQGRHIENWNDLLNTK